MTEQSLRHRYVFIEQYSEWRRVCLYSVYSLSVALTHYRITSVCVTVLTVHTHRELGALWTPGRARP